MFWRYLVNVKMFLQWLGENCVFKKYPAWSWKDISKLYTESRFLNLDLDVIPIINFDFEAPVHMEVDQEVLSNVKDEDDFTYIELPCKRKWRAKKAGSISKKYKMLPFLSMTMRCWMMRYKIYWGKAGSEKMDSYEIKYSVGTTRN